MLGRTDSAADCLRFPFGQAARGSVVAEGTN